MKSFRVAIGTIDGATVIDDHFGESEKFLVFEVFQNGEYELIDERKNESPKEEHGKHGLEEKRSKVVEIVKDCDMIVAGRKSPSYIKLRDKSKIVPAISKISKIDEFFTALNERFEEIYELIEKKRTGERPKEIPVFAKE